MSNPFGDEALNASAGNPFSDEEVQVAEPGFFTSAKRGLAQSKVGYNAANIAGTADMYGMLDKLEKEGDTAEVQEFAKNDLMFANHYNLWKTKGKDPAVIQALKAQQKATIEGSQTGMRSGLTDIQANPPSPELEAFHREGQTSWSAAFRNLAKAPISTIGQVTAESLGQQAPTLPLTVAAGATTGPAGMAATTGFTSFLQERFGAESELIAKSGIDPNDTDALIALMNSPEYKAEQAKATKKAAVVGGMDAAAALVAGVTLGKTPLRNIGAQTGVQMFSGGAGEALGSMAIDEPVSPAAVISEVIGEIPGGVTDVGSLALRRAKNVNALNRAADERQKEVDLGLNTEQEKTAADIDGSAHKQKLSPLQTQIFLQAAQLGVDPQAALTIAGLESDFRVDAKNPKSSAHGLFQLIDDTWDGVGGGDRNDVNQQILNGLMSIKQTQDAMAKRMGKNPSPEQIYYGHLLGPRGGAALAVADTMDPQGSFLDLVKTWDAKNAEAIVNNNGFKGMTNEQVARKIDSRFGQKATALGSNEALNRQAKASPVADRPPAEDITGEQYRAEVEGLEDLDQIFADLDNVTEVTPDVEQAAKAEEIAEKLEKGESDVETLTDAQLLAGETTTDEDAEVQVVQPNPRLPRDLAGAAPRYGFANRLFSVEFRSDVDRAAYIIANENKRSDRDADFLKFVMEHTGMTEAEARAYGKEVRAGIRKLAHEMKDSDVDQLVYGEQKRAESWTSLDELGTRTKYDNPNDRWKDRLQQAPILDDEDGATLNDRPIQPGEVVAVGEDSHQTPVDYMRAARDTIQEVISRFAPTARVALTFFTEGPGAVSSMQQVRGFGVRNRAARGRGLYHMNLRNAAGLGNETTNGSKNTTTQRKITYAAYHEAGHVIVDEQMLAGMPPALREKFLNLGIDEYFDEADLALLPPEKAAVLAEYNDLKWQALNDPNFTVKDFVSKWLSPWKTGHGSGKDQGIRSFVKMFMGQQWVPFLDKAARDFAIEMHNKPAGAGQVEILSPHEYMAEQFSRYAFSTGIAENSPLAQSFFRQALETLRKFFRTMKAEGAMKPGVAFSEWMDSLSVTGAMMPNNALPDEVSAPPAAEKSRAKPKVKPKLKAKAAPKPIEPPSMLEPIKADKQAVETVRGQRYDEKQKANFQLLASSLAFVADEDPKTYKHWSELIENGRLEDFRDEVANYIDEEYAQQKVRADADVPDVGERMRYDADAPETAEWRDIEAALEKAVPKRAGLRRWLANGLRKLSDAKYMTMTLEQMAFRFPEVAGLQTLSLFKTNYKAFKAKLELRGVEAVRKWSKLGKEQHGLLEQAMREEHFNGEHFAELAKVNGVWRFVPSEKLVTYATEKGLDEDTVAIWLETKNAHLSHMNALKNVMIAKLQQRFRKRPATLQKKLAELNQMFDHIRAEPFLPQTRFGEFALRVTENTPLGEKVVHVEFFESAAMRDEAIAQLKGKVGRDRTVQAAFYRPNAGILRTLPVQLLSTYADVFELTNQERKELREIADGITRNPTLRRYSSQLAGITGANKNLLRNFADFMWHSANNIAKLHYRDNTKRAVMQIEADMLAAAEEGNVEYHRELQKIHEFAKGYADHIMSPVDEWQKVRAFVVITQLWGNIKTAVANMTSIVPIWALAARQQGLLAGSGNTASAFMKSFAAQFESAANRVLRSQLEGGQVFNADTRWALDQAKQHGLLDESFAAQLAQFANSGTLSRLNFQHGDSIYKRAIWLGMLPQHMVESFMRRTSLILQFEHYMKTGLAKEEAYLRAQRDTYLTQGDNSLLNRPEFMRGKASVFFIYYGFIQNQLYLFSGAQERARNLREAQRMGETDGMTAAEARKKYFKIDKMGGETVKLWMAYAALGGMMGLPGAEDLDNIMELLAKKFFGERFSLKEYAYALAATIAEEASAFGVDINPRSIVHGTMADFSLFGVGPSVDMSPSVSLGSVVPGGQGIGDTDANRGLIKMMGPVGGAAQSVYNALFSDDPTKRWGILGMANNVAKTWREWETGVIAPNGGKITVDRETGMVRDLTTGENLVRLLGFNPEIIAANKEIHWMQREVQTYWKTRRDQLVTQYYEARRQDDREAVADAREKLNEFNESAPTKLKINALDLRKAVKRKDKSRKAQERLKSREKRFARLDRELRGNVTGSPDGEDD